MMTLEQAIVHAREVGLKMACKKETCECGKEHLQLAKWLEELKAYREGRQHSSNGALSIEMI